MMSDVLISEHSFKSINLNANLSYFKNSIYFIGSTAIKEVYFSSSIYFCCFWILSIISIQENVDALMKLKGKYKINVQRGFQVTKLTTR